MLVNFFASRQFNCHVTTREELKFQSFLHFSQIELKCIKVYLFLSFLLRSLKGSLAFLFSPFILKRQFSFFIGFVHNSGFKAGMLCSHSINFIFCTKVSLFFQFAQSPLPSPFYVKVIHEAGQTRKEFMISNVYL